MSVSIFGLGYVGAVSAACFADRGHKVIGVDPNTLKVELLNKGHSPIVEAGLAELIEAGVASGHLRATTNAEEAIANTDVTYICVGTPSLNNGNLDFSYLEKVCQEIGRLLAKKTSFHVVVVRSTVLPGTMRGMVIPMLEKYSGKVAGIGFGVCNNPEFLREGTALHDFNYPPKTVIGETDEQSGDIIQRFYEGLPGPMIRCPIEVGEMVKYADNAWHATKVAFANEIGKFCKAHEIDSHKVMDIFCQDTKLNISTYYMRPGFAFGGSCLPKDVRALTYNARSNDVSLPLLESLLASNHAQVEQGINMVLATGMKKVGILGFSFKAGTDDLRESPLVEVIERLLGKGFDLKIYDRNVSIAKLTGANKEYIYKVIPHIERLMSENIDTVLEHSDVIVIGNASPEFAEISKRILPEKMIIDFVRIKAIEEAHENYQGICW